MRIAPASSSSYPLRPGNFVRPLVDGVPAFRAIAKAVEAATRSVWVTVAFLDEDLAFPDARGSFFHVLERAAARGVDVRVLFWSEPEIEKLVRGSSHFPACRESFDTLSASAPHVLARWDRLRNYCHHQKSWLVDAGTDAEVAFVGGINLDHDSIVSPGHPHGEAAGGSTHDVYAELRGPSATDVHHNFVQRWNEASERHHETGAFPSLGRADDLPFPSRVSPERGESMVQVARTISSEVYRCGAASPGASPFDIAGGESSIVQQYLAAVEGAERTIYLENQIVLCPFLVPALDAALARGVEVVLVVPATAMPALTRHRHHPLLAPAFRMVEELARHDNFLMAALGTVREDGTASEIYVHSKVAVVDDEWTTIGSANAMFRSFRDDTEMNISTWDRAVASALRKELFAEHLGLGVHGNGQPHANGNGNGRGRVASSGRDVLCDDRASMRLLRETALDNSERRRQGRTMQGQIFAIDPRRWAQPEH